MEKASVVYERRVLFYWKIKSDEKALDSPFARYTMCIIINRISLVRRFYKYGNVTSRKRTLCENRSDEDGKKKRPENVDSAQAAATNNFYVGADTV